MVIYFKENFLGNLLQKDEMSQVNALFERAKNGLEFFEETVREISGLLSELAWHHGMERLVQLFRILDVLSHTREFHKLNNAYFLYKLNDTENTSITLIYNYTARYFTQNNQKEKSP